MHAVWARISQTQVLPERFIFIMIPAQDGRGQPHGTGVRQLQMSEDTILPQNTFSARLHPPACPVKYFLMKRSVSCQTNFLKNNHQKFSIFENLFFEIKILRLEIFLKKSENDKNLKKSLRKISKNLIQKSQKNLMKNLKILISKIIFQKSKNFDDYFLKSFLGMKRFISSKNSRRDARERGAE